MNRKLISAMASVGTAVALVALTPVVGSAATPYSFAVIGDIPYGTTQVNSFPQKIAQINADPSVQLVSHLGDIGGPPNCSDDYYATVKSDFDLFADPMLYTPGDNEWADCSGATVGAGNPLDRLTALRKEFFPHPGTSLGVNSIPVTAEQDYPENVIVDQSGLTMAMLHIVGSQNDLNTWAGYSAPTSAQVAEVNARNAATVQLISDAFTQAQNNSSRAVVLMTQADMFINSPNRSAFGSVVKAIAAQSAAFKLPVFLFNGDTHTYANDKPLNTGSSWLSYYGITTPVPNLTRYTVDGGASVNDWLKVTVVDTSAVLQVQKVVYSSNAAPTASFTFSSNALTASFNASASSDSNGSISSYAWSFGDGTTGNGVSPTHTYAVGGTYPVGLTVTDNGGATGTTSSQVTVAAAPPAGDTTTTVVVPAKSVWNWRFNTTAPDAAWKNPGYSTAGWSSGPGSLGYGFSPLGTSLNPASNTASRPLAAYFVRQFPLADASKVTQLALTTAADDGVVVYVNGTEVNRTNMPNGTVTIKTYALTPVTTSQAKPVTVNVPLALLRDGTNTIAAETHLNYHATASVSFDLSATVTTANDGAGGGGGVPNATPTASFTSATSGLSASFDGSASSDPDGTIASYAWTFGDGTTGTGATPSHPYSTAGTYNVGLTVTDNDGATATKSGSVTVSAPSGATTTAVLVPAKSVWNWRFVPGAPDASWKNFGYDASSWNSGAGSLGYGFTPLGTSLNPASNTASRPLAAYFVRNFTVADASSVVKLTLQTVADDGVVVYVNGTEVGRSNMPSGPVTINTYASTGVVTATANSHPVVIDVPVALLRNGTNTIAAETHLNYHATYSVSFDLTATATIS